eukprot:scaffold5408_cov676-Prasinococcus_capsulatus_cf.AAC.2
MALRAPRREAAGLAEVQRSRPASDAWAPCGRPLLRYMSCGPGWQDVEVKQDREKSGLAHARQAPLSTFGLSSGKVTR